MKVLLPSLLALLPVLTSCVLAAPAPTESEVRAILRNCVKREKRTPGLVAAWLDEHGSHLVSYGTRDGSSPVDGNTVFEIGSITKTFTATLLALMAERGELSLNDPAQKFLPSSVRMPQRNGRQITLLDLATQHSGLPRLPSNMAFADPQNPYADYTVEELYAFLSGYKLTRDIGSEYEYSNLGVGLLGHILALRAGTNYEALVVTEICQPLHMDSTRITLTPGLKARLAIGHNQKGRVTENWDIPTLAGAGALRSTANDLLKYLAANMGMVQTPLSAAMAKTHAIQCSAGSPDMSIGLAWHIRKKFGSEIVWHNGGTGGYHSFIGWDKTSQHGIVILSNSANDIDDIAWHLLNPAFKLSR